MATQAKMSTIIDLRGLDLVTPVDLLSDGHTPYSKNFRLYAQQADDRRVAVSSRKGPGYYTETLGETVMLQNTATTEASTAELGVIQGVHAIPFTATNSERLSRVDINLKDVNLASGPILVEIHSNVSSGPGVRLTDSAILSGDVGSSAAWSVARFLNAVELSSGSVYWLVLRVQDDGKNTYSLSTTTAGTKAWKTDSTLSQLTEQLYSLNYKIYTAPSQQDKNTYRFAQDNGVNTTLAAYGTSMYYVNETTHALEPIMTGLSASAVEYSFTNGDNKVFWVNGYDELLAWDGKLAADWIEKLTNRDFEVNTTGWTAGAGTTLTRSTAQFHSGVASASLTAASGVRSMNQTLALDKDRRYKVSFWSKGAAATGNVQLTLNGGSAVTESVQALTTGWLLNEFYFAPTAATTTISIQSTGADVFFDDLSILQTGMEYIRDAELPILSLVGFHKDRLWGRTAADHNKLVFSENPGNPSNLATNLQWYRAWLSVSFIYVPRPHNGSPVTGFVSFQDSLIVFTQDDKYVISGYDRGSFNLRKSTGSKGALSQRGIVADENNIYFVSDDGFYMFNGSSDEKLSKRILPLFDACANKSKITPIVWGNQVRWYMASQGSAVNNICTIYDKDLEEWLLDTDTYVNRALYYNDADDNGQLVEFSAHTGTAYLAEQSYNSNGAPIDFEYRLKYDSLKTPMQKKRLRRFYPILQGVDSTFMLQLAMDKDFEDSPKVKEQLMTTNGSKVGVFNFGDGTLFGSDTSFKPQRQSYSGSAYYWQLRVKRRGVNNRVAFVGAQFSYKTKRL